ncbi:MAG: 30S ribosomal protein S19e [Candidatus Nanohaloarchaeota archaeon QJJ-7]|nr:30S ribosomal protein S19e [Candidatus Nanohaloarchaeota archaeon QJJ-7]
MKTIYGAEPEALIDATAEKLEEDYEEVDMPEWAEYVKTGVHKERPPTQEDWWYVRSAAVLRKIYKEGPLGTETLRSMYGGRHKRGHQTEHFAKASGKVIRTVLQQLEGAGLVELEEGEGRKITAEGQSLLDSLAKEAGE